MLRELCVVRRRWIPPEDFTHATAVTQLLPGPASTQLAIYCAWRVSGLAGAIIGGCAFILPGLVAIVALAAVMLGNPPPAMRAAAAGAAAMVPAIALHAGVGLLPAREQWPRAAAAGRFIAYVVAGAASAALMGPWLVAVLVAAGLVEVAARGLTPPVVGALMPWWIPAAVFAPLVWLSFTVGALSYGGGFVIVPMMQAAAVEHHGWMTHADFLNAVVLGQATPGPVTHTVAVVGFAAAGLAGAVIASVVAFGPSFGLVMAGARHFEALRRSPHVQGFLAGAGPASTGAIMGSAIPLALALETGGQWLLAAGGVLVVRWMPGGVVALIAVGAAIGLVAWAGGLPLAP